jgi:UDP-N-acetylmuramoyl-L-alanyl-D-glutamate--2,6-diaminopimelate ligase
MGQAVSAHADIAVFTSDNPRTENPDAILQAMTAGIDVAQPSQIISDRAEAISYAVSLAGAGDTVAVLGKGHELGQEINGKVLDFDDRVILAKAIEAKR